LALRPTNLYGHVVAFDVTGFVQPFKKARKDSLVTLGQRPSFDGIVRGLQHSGAGSRESGQGGQRSIESCAISSDE